MSALASLKLTAVGIVLFAIGIAGYYSAGVPAETGIAAPMALLALNLCAAIVSNPVFRRQGALLVFHIALLALALLVAIGQFTYLKGRAELSTGVPFSGELRDAESGPLHPRRLESVRFVSEGFEIDYAPNLRRGETRNRVRWIDRSGEERSAVIGDQTPLVVNGYRFYTTPNKGFAPVFTWQPARGAAQRGTIHLPSFPAWQNVQSADWTPPGMAQRLTFTLHLDEPMVDLDGAWQLRLPARHRLELESGSVRTHLVPGDAVQVDGGSLRYEGLTTWMGYQVFYDWTLPWLLAACLVAVASLGWYYWGKLFARPWLAEAA